MTGWSGWSGWSGWLDGWWVGWEGPPTGISFAEDFDGRGALGLADFLVALLERVRLEALPRQTAAQKVHEHVAQRLQIVPPTLLCGPKKRKKQPKNNRNIHRQSPHASSRNDSTKCRARPRPTWDPIQPIRVGFWVQMVRLG